MTTMTANKAFNAIQKRAEEIKNDDPQRMSEAAQPGDYWPQGDVNIWPLSAVPEGCVVEEKPSAQLAPGTTQGSRHILDALDGVTVYRLPNPTALDGPILNLAAERTITHPEHGNLILPPGVYGVTYQRAFAEEIRRVAD